MNNVTETRGLQVTASTAVKEKRLASLLAGRDPATLGLFEAVMDAQVAGSLELSGIPTARDTARAARKGEEAPEAARRLYGALRAVPAGAPFSVTLLRTWHATATGAPSRYRTAERPPAAPAEFIEGRLGILEQWLNAESRRQLKPAQAGALVLARVLEILPFDEGNGRVARLAASHLMVQGGASPPILLGADAPRLKAAVEAAFQLATAPLSDLLEEASARKVDVWIRALE
jgi:Fic family protein